MTEFESQVFFCDDVLSKEIRLVILINITKYFHTLISTIKKKNKATKLKKDKSPPYQNLLANLRFLYSMFLIGNMFLFEKKRNIFQM